MRGQVKAGSGLRNGIAIEFLAKERFPGAIAPDPDTVGVVPVINVAQGRSAAGFYRRFAAVRDVAMMRNRK
jgi:hypothetical protein